MKFNEVIIQKAKTLKNKILLLPESTDRRMLEACKIIIDEDIAEKVVLFGSEEQLNAKIEEYKLDLRKNFGNRIETVDHIKDARRHAFAKTLFEARKHKGMSEERALSLMEDPLWFASMLIKQRLAHAMVAGAVHSTANVLKPAIQIVGTIPHSSLVSSCFVMESPETDIGGHEGAFIFSDCGIIPRPSSEELAEIAIAASHSCNTLLNTEPLIALTSFSTKGSASHEEVTKIQKALELVKIKRPDLKIDGELQMDAALNPRVAATKAPHSSIAGRANTLVFPDLNSANIAYKTAQYFGKMKAFGPLIQGLNGAINDLSRGCVTQEIVTAAAITICQGVSFE